jgi:ABC-2 type transport system permease protein
MSKIWLVFLYEYKRHVLRKRFLFALLSMPLFVLLLVGIGFIAVYVQYNSTPVGYLDPANVLPNARQVPPNSDKLFPPVEVRRYDNEEAARQALTAGQIQTYFILDANYLNNGQARMVTNGKPANNATGDFSKFLRYNLLNQQPAAVAERLSSGSFVTIRAADGSREFNENNFMGVLAPLFAGVLFMIAVNTSGGYLLQAVVEEKENRTMEIIITSISPNQLMAGKILGNLSVGLTELAAWIGFALLGVLAAQRLFDLGANLSIGGDYLLLILATFLPAFVMVSALMGAVGAIATESREAQQIAGLFTLPIMIPYYFVTAIILNPNSPLSVGLSLFPLTAPITLPLRQAFTNIPAWQLVVSISLLILCALGAVWMAGRIFRTGMLQYGKRLSWKQIVGRA